MLTATATRNLALIQTLGGAALCFHEARTCPPTRSRKAARTTRAARCYPRVHDKDNKIRSVPLYTDVADALERGLRDEIPELVDDPSLFPRLGGRQRDGSFPDAGGQLSPTAVIRIVRPIMLAAG